MEATLGLPMKKQKKETLSFSGKRKFLSPKSVRLIFLALVIIVFGVEGFFYFKLQKQRGSVPAPVPERPGEGGPGTTSYSPGLVLRLETPEEYVNRYPIENFVGFGYHNQEENPQLLSIYGTLEEINLNDREITLRLSVPEYLKSTAEERLGEALPDYEQAKIVMASFNEKTEVLSPYSGELEVFKQIVSQDERIISSLTGSLVETVVLISDDQELVVQQIYIITID